jgi:MOSC domain-containing protein
MIEVAELWRYPVKSMAGEQLDRAELRLDGIPGDRALYVIDRYGEILSARTRPQLLRHHATIGHDGSALVDGEPWDSPQVAAAVHASAGPGARIVEATGPERFDILPLLVATDGAIEAFGYDRRRLRPNIVLSGVPGLLERMWEWRQLVIGEVIVSLADLRGRCIITTWDPDTVTQDVDVLRHIQSSFDGTLALNAWAGRPGTIAVGDEVRVLTQAAEVARPQVGRFVAQTA